MKKSSNICTLSTAGAAEFFCTSPSVIKQSRATGTLWGNPAPRFMKVGARKVLYKQSDLEVFINQFDTYSNNAQVNATCDEVA